MHFKIEIDILVLSFRGLSYAFQNPHPNYDIIFSWIVVCISKSKSSCLAVKQSSSLAVKFSPLVMVGLGID